MRIFNNFGTLAFLAFARVLKFSQKPQVFILITVVFPGGTFGLDNFGLNGLGPGLLLRVLPVGRRACLSVRRACLSVRRILRMFFGHMFKS